MKYSGIVGGEEAISVEREEVHLLVDNLAPSQVAAVHGLLAAMLDLVSRAIANAPIDDEPESEEERQAVAEADEWLQHNKEFRLRKCWLILD